MEEKKVSATSLLDVTPSPPREADESITLQLADSDPSPGAPLSADEAPPSPSQVETQRSPTAPPPTGGAPKIEETPLANMADISGPFEETPAASDAETRRVVMPGVVADPPQSVEEIELQEDSGDEEPAPLSLRDAIIEEKPMELSSEHETVSLRDLVVMPPVVEPDSTPPPPMRGALRTLPPDPGKFKSAAPPPTIMVDDAPPPSVRPKAPSLAPKGSVPPKLPASAASVPPKLPASAASVPPKRSLPPPLKKPVAEEEASSESARPAPLTRIAPATLPPAEAEEPKRSVIMPAIAIAVAGFIFWRIMSSPSKVETPPTPTTTTTATATAEPTATETASTPPSAEPAASESASAAPTTAPPAPSATVATSTTSETPAPKATATATAAPTAATTTATTAETGDKPKPATPVGEMSMGDMLDKAGSAKRSGDYPTARDLYERVLKQSPANVEANGGLGDVARAQGDASAAKASYQRALSASPSYSPALLGLADIEWDEGNRDSASARYGKIVEQMRGRAPQRARDRAPATE